MLSPAKQLALFFNSSSSITSNFQVIYVQTRTVSLVIDDLIKEHIINSLEDHNFPRNFYSIKVKKFV